MQTTVYGKIAYENKKDKFPNGTRNTFLWLLFSQWLSMSSFTLDTIPPKVTNKMNWEWYGLNIMSSESKKKFLSLHEYSNSRPSVARSKARLMSLCSMLLMTSFTFENAYRYIWIPSLQIHLQGSWALDGLRTPPFGAWGVTFKKFDPEDLFKRGL